MTSKIILLGLTAVMATGCARLSNTSANPFTWFDRDDTSVPAQVAPEHIRPIVPEGKTTVTVDQRAPAQSIVAVERARVDGGVMLTAQVMSSRPGPFNAEIVVVDQTGTTLILEPRMQYPQNNSAVGQVPVAVGVFLPAGRLVGVRSIVVRSLTNQRSLRP